MMMVKGDNPTITPIWEKATWDTKQNKNPDCGDHYLFIPQSIQSQNLMKI